MPIQLWNSRLGLLKLLKVLASGWNSHLYFNDISKLLNNVKESWVQLGIKASKLWSAWVLSGKRRQNLTIILSAMFFKGKPSNPNAGKIQDSIHWYFIYDKKALLEKFGCWIWPNPSALAGTPFFLLIFWRLPKTCFWFREQRGQRWLLFLPPLSPEHKGEIEAHRGRPWGEPQGEMPAGRQDLPAPH